MYHDLYIYIYARGRGLPDGTSKKISVISKKLRFTVVKRWFFQHCFLSVTHFHDGSIFFGPSKLKLYNDYVWFYFKGLSIFPIGFTRRIFFDEKKNVLEAYKILRFRRYFDMMLFFIGNFQWFWASLKRPRPVSQPFFLSFRRPKVLPWTLSLACGNSSLPAFENELMLLRHFPKQGVCWYSAQQECCDVQWVQLPTYNNVASTNVPHRSIQWHASYSNVACTDTQITAT